MYAAKAKEKNNAGKCEKYNSVGTFEERRDTAERQMGKEPAGINSVFYSPSCVRRFPANLPHHSCEQP